MTGHLRWRNRARCGLARGAAMVLALCASRAALSTPADRQHAFAPADIVEMLHRANNHQQANPWRALDRNWIRGTYFTGVMAFYEATNDPSILAQALHWSEVNGWQPGWENSGANKLTCAQTYLQLYFLQRDPRMIEPLIQWLHSGHPATPTGAKVWYLEGGARYVDSLYVGAPTLAMLSAATGDPVYLEWMDAFFWSVVDECLDREDGLFYRDARYRGRRTAAGKKVYWSRGNGWLFAALPRILRYLPESDPRYARYRELYGGMAAAIAARQLASGFFCTNLADPAQFPGPETSGTGFFVYGFAWGVRHGVLERATYLPVIRNGWGALAEALSEEGKVQWGQQVGAEPVEVAKSQSHEYVTGTFLLAGSEVLGLARAGALLQ